jgi:hypothetical protein
MEGFEFVKKGGSVGATMIASVKHDEVFGRQLHSEIPLLVISVAVLIWTRLAV